MPLPPDYPIALHGAPLTPPPPTGPHKPSLAIQARLAPELITAIVDARKKGLPLQFEAYGPDAGFHIDGKHFPIHSVVAERTPHEVYAYSATSQPELQVIGKVIGRCGVQRTLTEGDQEKLLQSRSAAENASTRTIGRLGVSDVPAKGVPTKRKPTVKKNVIDANTAAALRASPAPGTAGNSPPPTARSTTLDGPPNAFQTLLIHHLAYAPSTLQRLATAVKRQPKEIRGCLDSIATNDDSPTGPRPDSPTWTLKPSSYQYLRLAAPNGSASGGPWLTLTPEDTKRMIADANRAFDQLKLPPDAPPRLALAAQQPAPPPTPAPSAKPQESTTTTVAAPLKHPLPARPTTTPAPNGRLDAPKPSRVASPAVPASDVGASPRETPAVPTPRVPVRTSAAVKEKPKAEGDAEPISTKKNGGTKSKSSANGKEKTKVKSKPIITADSDGEDFVATKRDRERKPPPPAAAPPPLRTSAVPSTLHSRAPSATSSRNITDSSTKKSKRDADIALELEREIEVHDSGFIDSSSRSTTATAAAPTKATSGEGKKRRMNEEAQPRVRVKGVDRVRAKEGKVGSARDPERKVKTASREVSADVKRKRDVDQESDVSFDTRDVEKKKKRRTESTAVGAPPPALSKREHLVREREADTSTVEGRPKKALTARDPDSTLRVKEPRKAMLSKTNGASTSAPTSTSVKINGSSKKERASVMYTSSEDEGTPPAPVQRRPPTASASGPPPARSTKLPAPSPSEASTPRDRDRDRERDRRKAAPPGGGGIILPPKRPPLPANASVEDVRDRYAEVYADYMGLNARLSTERVKVQRLLKDMDDGDHDAILDASTVESLTKAYLDAHEELVALKVRVGAGA
ncbi:hypothetical protein FRC06_005806 [Ceratobasidium sp. 370]|nr:hypothetical protein FRC06_005806 [Ceratobasidium sp. 370]